MEQRADGHESVCAVSDLAEVAVFETVLRDAHRSARAVAFRLVGNDVDDVLQTAYVKAFRHWSSFRGESAPRTWLHRIVYTTAMDHLRGKRRIAVGSVGEVESSSPGDVADQAVESVDLARALQALPYDQRVTLLLVDAEGFSNAEAADVLGVASGTVASRLHRARRAVRAQLKVMPS